jgi:glyoxylase-like metal-dependent hydrolase (beta-lactamase superfamily II)
MKLSNNCYAVTGLYYIPPWSVNAGFIIGDNKTLIIDSGSNYISAQTIYGYANTAKPDNEIILINTERHLDHIGGNGYFSEKGIKIYGHELIDRNQNELIASIIKLNGTIANINRKNNNEAFIAFKNTKIINPYNKFREEFEIDLGGFDVQILLTPGHTKTNVSVYNEKDKVIYCGDCVLPDFIPNLEEGNNPEWHNWIESLEKIKSLDIEILLPGHGNVIIGKTEIQKEIERTKNIILDAIKNDKAPTAINKKIKG